MKLEIESVTQTDKGSYKLIAKNEKGEATSQTVEVTEIPEEEEVKKGNKPEFSQGLTSVVSYSPLHCLQKTELVELFHRTGRA